jgi:hypothetical protein
MVRPCRIEALHRLVFDGTVMMDQSPPDLATTRKFVLAQLQDDFSVSITRYDKPVEYGVTVSLKLYEHLHSTWEKEHPIKELE